VVHVAGNDVSRQRRCPAGRKLMRKRGPQSVDGRNFAPPGRRALGRMRESFCGSVGNRRLPVPQFQC
jgi:hypothetical protein